MVLESSSWQKAAQNQTDELVRFDFGAGRRHDKTQTFTRKTSEWKKGRKVRLWSFLNETENSFQLMTRFLSTGSSGNLMLILRDKVISRWRRGGGSHRRKNRENLIFNTDVIVFFLTRQQVACSFLLCSAEFHVLWRQIRAEKLPVTWRTERGRRGSCHARRGKKDESWRKQTPAERWRQRYMNIYYDENRTKQNQTDRLYSTAY